MTCPDCTPRKGLCPNHQITPEEWEALWGYLKQQEEEGIAQLLDTLNGDEG